MAEEFTNEEREMLNPFFTNLDKDVFVLRNLPEVVKGALFSRYSRTNKSLRRVLLDEFIKKPEMGFKQIVGYQIKEGVEQTVAIRRAEEFYDRILVGFGDDSVAELGGAHLACENVSNIATKALEESRIGLSPLEKSSRYVVFDEKVNGKYKYYLEPRIMESEFADLYVKTNDLLFETYSKLWKDINKYVMEIRSQKSDESDRAYKTAIKAKTCDIVRVLLPASTLTNLGIFGNGRAFEYLLLKMYANDLKEMQILAKEMHKELEKVIPSFVKRCDDKYGKQHQEFLRETRNGMENIVREVMGKTQKPEKEEELQLVEYDKNSVDKVVAAIIYTYSDLPLEKIKENVLRMDDTDKRKIISEYCSRRKNRRQRPGRAFENSYYIFDILGNYGIYRDLQRHRILTQERQLLTTDHGYDIPKEVENSGHKKEFVEALDVAKEAFETMRKKYPKEAQYIVPFAYKLRWYFGLNARELYHLIELRTMRQGHPSYRRICQKMYKEVKRVHQMLFEHMVFVDMNTYDLERIEAEKKIDKKIEMLKKKESKKE